MYVAGSVCFGWGMKMELNSMMGRVSASASRHFNGRSPLFFRRRSDALLSGTAVAGLLALGLCAAGADPARAETYVWNPDGASVPAGGTTPAASGTWSASVAAWTLQSTGGTATVAWPSSTYGLIAVIGDYDSYFSPTDPFEVTVDGTIMFDTMTHADPGFGQQGPTILFSGGTFEFAPGGTTDHATLGGGVQTSINNAIYAFNSVLADGHNEHGDAVTDLLITSGAVLLQNPTYTGTTTLEEGALLQLGAYSTGLNYTNIPATVSVNGEVILKNNAALSYSSAAGTDYAIGKISSFSATDTDAIVVITGALTGVSYLYNQDNSGFVGTTILRRTLEASTGKVGGVFMIESGGSYNGEQGTTFTTDSLAFRSYSPGGTINAHFTSNTGGDALLSTGALDTTYGLLTVNLDAAMVDIAGVYNIIAYSGAVTTVANTLFSAAPSFTGQTPGTYYFETTSASDGILRLIVLDAQDELAQYWNGAGSTGNPQGGNGTWNSATANWASDAAATGQSAWAKSVGIFANNAGTVTVDGNLSFDRLEFKVDGYEIAGAASNTLALSPYSAATGTISVDSGFNATIGVDIVNGNNFGGGPVVNTLSKKGDGNLVFIGTKSYTGLTTVEEGTLTLGDGTNVGGLTGGLTVNAGATLNSVANSSFDQIEIGELLTLAASSRLTFTLDGGYGSNSLIDASAVGLTISGSAGSETIITVDNLASLASNTRYYLIHYGAPGNLTGTLAGLKYVDTSAQIYQDTSLGAFYLMIGPPGGAGFYWHPQAGADFGGNGTWTATGNLNWYDNMVGPQTAWTQSATAVFQGDPSTVTVAGTSSDTIKVGGLSFKADNQKIAGGSGETLTIDGSFGDVKIFVDSLYTASLDVVLGDGGSGYNVEKDGAGKLVLTQSATYTGSTTITAGTFQLGDGASGNVTLAGDVTINGGGSEAKLSVVTGTTPYNFGLTLTGSALTDVFEIAGTGKLDLTVANAGFAGTTRVLSGATLSGTVGASLGGTATIADGATLLGTQGASPVITFDTLVLTAGALGTSGSIVAANFTSASATPLFDVATALTLGGALQANKAGPALNDGTYTIFSAGAAPSGTLLIDFVNSSITGAAQIQITGANDVVLVVGDTPGPGGNSVYEYWNGVTVDGSGLNGGSGTWTASASAKNWTDRTGAATDPWTTGHYARFADTGSGGTVTVDAGSGAVTGVMGLVFETDGYSIVGASLGLSSAYSDMLATIEVASGLTAKIDADLAGANYGIRKTGAGTAILTGDKTFGGATSVAAGTLQLGDASGLVTNYTSDITVAGGAKLSLFAETAAMKFANKLTGVAGASQEIGGSNIVYFNGDNKDNFVGTTTIVSGATLAGTGSMGGEVHVAAGATLSGTYLNANPLTVGYSTGGTPGGKLVLDDATSVISVYLDSSNTGSMNSLFITDVFEASSFGTINVGFAATSLQNGTYALIDLNTALGPNYDFTGFTFTGKTGQYSLTTRSGGTLTQQIVLVVGPPGATYWNPTQGSSQADLGYSGTWTADPASFNWSAENGTGAGPWAQGYEAIFESNAGTVTVDSSTNGAIEVAGLDFRENFDLVGGATQALTLVGGAYGATINVDAGTAATIDVVLTENAVSGLIKAGDGALTLKQAGGTIAAYTGDTKVTEGSLTLAYASDVSVASNYVITDGATLIADTGGNLTFASGKTIARTVNGAAPAVAAFEIAGGTVTMNSDSSTFNGATTVDSGATLTGVGKLGGDVSLLDGSFLTGDVTTGSTMTVGSSSLSAASGSTIAITLNDTPNTSPIFETGKLSIDVGVDLTITPSVAGTPFQNGIYPLIQHDNALIGSTGNFNMTTAIATVGNVFYTIAATGNKSGPGTISLVVGEDGYSYWNGTAPSAVAGGAGGSGTWTAQSSTTNWTDNPGSGLQAWNPNGYAVFQTQAGTVTVDASRPIEVNGMEFHGYNYDLVPKSATDSLTLVPLFGSVDPLAITVDNGANANVQVNMSVPLQARSPGQAITKLGNAELILSAPNSFGKLTVNAGTVTSQVAGGVPGDIEIGAGATWNWNVAAGGSYAGQLTGTGGTFNVNKRLTLTGNSNTFAGTTNVAGLGVTLTIPAGGQLAGAMNVSGSGTITGTGTFGDVVLRSGGGLRVGTGTPNGATSFASLTTEAGSRIQLFYRYSASTGTLSVGQMISGGSFTVNGGTVVIGFSGGDTPVVGALAVIGTVPSNSDFTLGTEWTISGGAPQYGFKVNYPGGTHPTEFQLEVVSGSIFRRCEYAGNACSAVRGLGSLDYTDPLFVRFMGVPEEELEDVLSQLSGDVYASVNGAMVNNSRYLRDATGAHMREAMGGVSTPNDISAVSNYAAETPVLTPFGPFEEINSGIGVWFTGYGTWSSIDGDGNAAKIKDTAGGMFIGADAAIGAHMRLGALVGYGQSSYEVDARNASGSSDDFTLGLYGGGAWNGFGVDFGAAYTWHDVTLQRQLNFSTFSESLQGDYDAGTFQAYGSLGYTFDITEHFQLAPYADLAYIHQQSGDFSEAGGLSALSHLESEMNTWFTTVGARAAFEFQLGQADSRITAAAGWRHGFGDLTPGEQVLFTGGNAFGITGAPLAEDQAVLSAGFETQINEMISVGINYSAQFGGGSTSQNVTGRLNVRF